MAAVIEQKEIVKGGSFLIEERTPAEIFTPEDFNEEHRMIADTTRQFMDAEVLPRIDELENKDWKLARELVKKGAELGLVGANIPEEYDGLGLDQTSGALIAENLGRSASFATTLGAQSGIGLLPSSEDKLSAKDRGRRFDHSLRVDRGGLGLGRDGRKSDGKAQ